MNFCHSKIIVMHSSKTYAEEQLPTISNSACEAVDLIKAAKHCTCMRNGKKSENLSHGKVELSTRNEPETMKLKMGLRNRIFHAGRVERFFRTSFITVDKEERLLAAHKCSLFTTAGPIKGTIFISTERTAFHSKKFLKLKTSKGEISKVPYKVSVPLCKINKTALSENLNRPEEKYVHIVTVDEFEFWFLDFINYQASFDLLCLAISGERKHF